MKKILFYKMYVNDRGNCITLNFQNKEEEKSFLESFRANTIDALNWKGEPLYGHGNIPYSAIIR